MKLSKSIVIVGAKRTAFGTMQGALKDVSATDLAVHAAKAALAQSGVAAEDVGHVIVGNVMQTSADAIYCARHVGPEGRAADHDARAHREPPLRLGLPGDRQRRRAAPPRRGRGRARRRHREHDAGAARPARRARRLGVRQGARGRGLALERAHRQLLQHADGGHRREPRDQVRHHARRTATRTRSRASSAGRRRTRRAASRTRSRRSSSQARRARSPSRPTSTRARRRRSRRSPSSRRSSRRTASSPPATRRASATARRALVLTTEELRQGERAQAARAPRAVGRRGRRADAHGHRPGAGDPERAHARGAEAGGRRPLRGERGVRAAVPRGREGARAPAREDERERRRDRARPPARRERRAHHGPPRLRARSARKARYAVGSACIGGGQGLAVVLERI